jgi:hypothetical protein
LITRRFVKFGYIMVSLHLAAIVVMVVILNAIGIILPMSALLWIGALIFCALVWDFGVKYLERQGEIKE